MTDDTYIGWHFDWIEQWSQFFQRCNWYDFTFIRIEVEDDRYLGGIEATVIVLGLECRVRWNHTLTPKMQEIRKQVAEIDRQEAARDKPDYPPPAR